MRCGHCGNENQPGEARCRACGADLPLACPTCGEVAGPHARFCALCGSQLVEVTAVVPPSAGGGISVGDLPTDGGERRHLTVMFCDLVGSTELAEALDPEDSGELVLAYQEMGRSVVTSLGGHIAQYLGDGLLAYFGYPTAHEDDPERAVRAGLAVVAGLERLNAELSPAPGVGLSARVGIHTGAALVGEMGSSDRSDTSVFGSTPNIASRLEAIAAPGSVVISDATGRLIDDRFRLADRGVPPLKGVSQQIHAFEVIGVDVLTAHTPVEPGTRLVGRSDELATLCERFEKVRTGQGQTVVVCGEPGVGKSRLLQALYREVADSPHVWLEFQCSELATGSPLQPIVEMLERTLGTGYATQADRREHLASLLAPLGLRAAGYLGYVGELVGIPDDDGLTIEGPELRRARVLEALAEWPLALAADRPVVIVAEDVHWCDPTSLELLRLVAEEGRHHRLLCVLTHRTDVEVDLPEPNTTIELLPLAAAEGEELVRRLAGDTELSADRVAALARRGDGVPLFIEELVSSAREGAPANGDTEVPPTLQGLLSARLDRLGPVRAVAQAASVLGREFPLALLEAVDHFNGAALLPSVALLEQAGVLITRDENGEVDCTFRHALIQDAAYSSLLRRQRRKLHARVVRVLEERFAGRLDATPELLAHHLAAAGEHLRAAEWYERAGRRAAVHAAFGEAVAHYRSGLACLERAPEGRPRQERTLSLDILMANALMGSNGLGSADLLPIWERAIALAEELGDQEELTSALNGAAVYHADHGEDDVAIAMAERIVAIADATGSRVAALRGNGTLGMTRFFRGDGERALAHTELALSLSREGDFESVTYGVGHDEGVFFHAMASWNLWWLGRPDAGLSRALEGSRQADALPSSLTQAMARHAVAMIRLLRGEGVHASVVAGENLRLTEEVGLPFWRGLALLVLGTELARRGDESGLGQLDLGLGLLIEEGNQGGASLGLALLADAQLHLGRFEQAIATADAGLATSASLRQPFYDPELLRLKALALDEESGNRTQAVALLEQSLALAQQLGARSWALTTATSLALLLGRAAGGARAREVLTGALAVMGDGGATVAQQRARALLGQLP